MSVGILRKGRRVSQDVSRGGKAATEADTFNDAFGEASLEEGDLGAG